MTIFIVLTLKYFWSIKFSCIVLFFFNIFKPAKLDIKKDKKVMSFVFLVVITSNSFLGMSSKINKIVIIIT